MFHIEQSCGRGLWSTYKKLQRGLVGLIKRTGTDVLSDQQTTLKTPARRVNFSDTIDQRNHLSAIKGRSKPGAEHLQTGSTFGWSHLVQTSPP